MSDWNKFLKSLFISLSFVFLVACGSISTEETTLVPEQNYEYGIAVDSFKIVKGQVEPGQALGTILYLHHIDHPKIDKIVRASKDIFDFRTARAGKNYMVLCTNDSIGIAQCFIYEENSTDYVVFDLRDSVHVYRGQKEIEVRIREASGHIESSLWNALMASNMSPALVMELSSIYAWTIDFFRIQKGDHFRVIYEEKYVEDEFIGIGRIWASEFNHSNEDFYAFYFQEDNNFGDYFDENGGTLRKAFLRAPLNYSRISSR